MQINTGISTNNHVNWYLYICSHSAEPP